MSWDLENKSAGNSNNGGSKLGYTKFEDGLTEIRVLDAVPYMRWSHWLPQYKRNITCTGMTCPICVLNKTLKANGGKAKYDNGRKWSLNIHNYNTGKHELMENGLKFMEELREALNQVKQDGKELGDAVISVKKRMGADGKAVWRMDVKEYTEFKHDYELVDRKEFFKAPTDEQVQALLTNTDFSAEKFNEIMGYGKQEEDTSTIGETEVSYETE